MAVAAEGTVVEKRYEQLTPVLGDLGRIRELCFVLRRLYISNFALIGEMDVSFPGGLTVITGETGAGKSIFLEALGLALGKRADRSALRQENRKCIVEAEFEVPLALPENAQALIGEHGDGLVIRREIAADGRSRCFVNDGLVSLSDLKPLAEALVSVHSQHQTLLLNQSDFQAEVVDAYAGNSALLAEYSTVYREVLLTRAHIAELEQRALSAAKENDFLLFQAEELKSAAITIGMKTRLEEEALSLAGSEQIRESLQSVLSALSESEENVVSVLARVKQSVSGLRKYGKRFEELHDRLQSVLLETKDIASDADVLLRDVVTDPARLDEVSGLLDRLARLFKKHHARDEDDLLRTQNELEARLLEFSSLDTELEAARKRLNKCSDKCMKLAAQLTAARKSVLEEISTRVVEMLRTLSMPHAEFEIRMSTLPETGAAGADMITFHFTANKGQPLAEVSSTASGGELSRLMLCLKALIAARKQLPAIIFDEIDTGVSGEAADKIGAILRKMAESMQVIVITHLPQMASKGRHHLFVYKDEQKEAAESRIRVLVGQERVTEIAKMLSAGAPTKSAVQNARELLEAAG